MFGEQGILLRYLKKYKLLMTLNITLAVFANFFNLLLPRLLQSLIDDVIQPMISDPGSISEDKLMSGLMYLFYLTLIFMISSGFLGLGRTLVQQYIGNNIIYEMRNDIFRALQYQSYSFFDQYRTGDLMGKATSDVQVVRNFLTNQFANFIRAIVILGLILVFVFSSNWILSLIFLGLTPPIFFLMQWYRKRIRPTYYKMSRQYGQLISVLQENVAGVRVVRAFGMEDHERDKFQKENQQYLEENRKVVKLSSVYGPANDLIAQGGAVLLIFIGALLVAQGLMQLGEVVAFYLYFAFVFDPIRTIAGYFSQHAQTMASADRIMEILDYRNEITEKPTARELTDIEGEITFENVSFNYRAQNRQALEKVSFKVQPGETVAILGATGSGKTSIINLIPRFYDPTEGRILIDGIDLRDVTVKSLRKQIGIVSQEIFLFSRSIEDNIRYGKQKVKKDDIERVAKIANIHDFIVTLPKKYKTVVGERGVTLSGGQKQRVAIARALLLEPKILVLDDSTSSVDVDTEYEIQKALTEMMHQTTTFIITQRISTIRNANRIFILENGKITEQGTHKELLEAGGIYTRIYKTLYRSQMQDDETGQGGL